MAKEHQQTPDEKPKAPVNLTIDEQGHPEDQFGQRNQPYDGEADPVLIIRANNEKRVFEQHGLVWPSPPVVPNPDDPKPGEEPVLTALTPSTAVVGSADVTMVVSGTNFTPKSVIYFNGGAEPTVWIGPEEVSTGVKPSLADGPGQFPVWVQQGSYVTPSLNFEFTAVPEARTVKDDDDDAPRSKKK
jgi:hypothetical protein